MTQLSLMNTSSTKKFSLSSRVFIRSTSRGLLSYFAFILYILYYLSSHPSAIDGKYCAVDITGELRCEKNHRPLKIIRMPPGACQYPRQDSSTSGWIYSQGFSMVSRNITWSYTIDIVAFTCPFIGQRFYQTPYRALTSCIPRDIDAPLKSQ